MINDFVEYWAAAKLLLEGGNPYSPTELLTLERTVGWSQPEPLLMWNPPWTLSLILPLGLLDHDSAQFAWFLGHSLIIFLGARVLWQLYGGVPKKARYASLAVLTFVPVYFALLLGQIGPVILLGLVGFLFFTQRKAWLLAAASISLVSVKPHLLYLFWLALACWVFQEYRWRLATASLLAGSIIAAIPLFWNSAIYFDYAHLLRNGAAIRPAEWATPTLGTALGVLLNSRSAWIRWLPCIGGTLWFVWYWSYRCRTWDWISDMPLILLVSVATASFAWTFDYVVLLPAVIQSAVWTAKDTNTQHRYMIIGFHLLLAAALVAGKVFAKNDFWYFWFAPMLLLLYLYVRARALRIR